METQIKLNWLAAGEIYFNGQLVTFNHVPSMAMTYSGVLLIAGARDHGLVGVDARSGKLLFIREDDQGQTVGVMTDKSRVFVVTATAIKVYCLRRNVLEPMAPLPTPDLGDGQFTGAMAVNPLIKTLYVRCSNGTRYAIFAVGYTPVWSSVLYSDDENRIDAVTHLFEQRNVVYGVQGAIGNVCLIDSPKLSVGRIHGAVASISANSDIVASTVHNGHAVTLWSNNFVDNSQYQLSLLQLFPEGQQATVLVHDNWVITFHASASLLHVFEWRHADTLPSADLRAIFAHPLHAHIDKTICRYLGATEVLSPDDLVDMMLNTTQNPVTATFDTSSEQEELVVVDLPPAKMARTMLDVDGNEVVDPSYFDFLDIDSIVSYFERVDDDEVEEENDREISDFLFSELSVF